MSSLIFRNRRNPAEYGVLNFMAGTNGFTMMDMVSYDQKHNEPMVKITGMAVITIIPGTAERKPCPQEKDPGAPFKAASQCHAAAFLPY